tara:strand:+ start:152 stop:280 length:129 start_codon:yes stop_codon:yes gene_type:complete
MKTFEEQKKFEEIKKLLYVKGWTPSSKIIKMLITKMKEEGEI